MLKDNQSKIKYADIIEMPHHVSDKRPHMPVRDRAAQFAPFAALTGHDDAVREAARLTDDMIELDEEEISLINEKLVMIQKQIHSNPSAEITYFVKDSLKDGGAYETAAGPVKKINVNQGILLMMDGTEIVIKNILNII